MAANRSVLLRLGRVATLAVLCGASTACRLSRPAGENLPPLTPQRDREESSSETRSALSRTQPDPEHDRLEDAREGLEDSDPERRLAAVWAARELGTSAGSLVDPLLGALDDDDENVRCAVVRAIAEVSAEPSRIAPALFDVAMNDPSLRVRSRAVGALGKLGPETIDIVLHDRPANERRARAVTARILRDIARAQPGALEALARILGNDDPMMREVAAWALWELGAEATPAMDALLAALADDDEDVRFYASWALGRMGAPAVASLVGELASEDRHVRCGAAQALGGIGAEAIAAVEPLRRLLGDADPSVRASVRQALARILGSGGGQA